MFSSPGGFEWEVHSLQSGTGAEAVHLQDEEEFYSIPPRCVSFGLTSARFAPCLSGVSSPDLNPLQLSQPSPLLATIHAPPLANFCKSIEPFPRFALVSGQNDLKRKLSQWR